jgi:nuclear transport factor 2 (NTF2) superfamily protein
MQPDSSPLPVSPQAQQLLLAAYQAFNSRAVETALALMTPEVDWPNGMEGGYVKGRSAVKEYWLRQWTMVNPNVHPVNFYQDNTGRITVEVHQVVKDLSGKVLLEGRVQHVYLLAEGLIKHMEIRP